MGMATIEQEQTPRPRYKGTVVCVKCHAEYNPSDHWYRGYYPKGTTDGFIATSKVPRDQCPMCLTPTTGGDRDD